MKNKQQLKEEAAARQEAYNKLTLDEKIQQCHNRRGKSRKELGRLIAVTQKV